MIYYSTSSLLQNLQSLLKLKWVKFALDPLILAIPAVSMCVKPSTIGGKCASPSRPLRLIHFQGGTGYAPVSLPFDAQFIRVLN